MPNGQCGGIPYSIEQEFVSGSPTVTNGQMRQPDFDIGMELCMGQDQEKENMNFDAMGLENPYTNNNNTKFNGYPGRSEIINTSNI